MHDKLVLPQTLGDASFRKKYNLRYNYIAGAMCKGIASKELVVKMGKAGLIGFLGTGGLDLQTIERNIVFIQSELKHNESYGLNLLHDVYNPEAEHQIVELYFQYGIKDIEAAAYMQITSALVRFRLKGIKRNQDGAIGIPHRIIAKVSRPEVAEVFMSPAPQRIVKELLAMNMITPEEAELSQFIPIASDICVESDSAGHTDRRFPYTLMPAFKKLGEDMMNKYKYAKKIHIGASGGIGTPEAAAAAFILGSDFILTGSINQCTVEAGTSDKVKSILQDINIQDTTYVPAGDMFEFGAQIQVLKKGLLFPARANKLYDLYKQYHSIEEIDEKTKKQIQERYFKRSFDEVWHETREYLEKNKPNEIDKANKNSKHKMALIFKWYFAYSSRIARDGDEKHISDYQILCSPALGAFNRWVKGSPLESWKNRHVDEIAEKLMLATAQLMNEHIRKIYKVREIERVCP